MYQCVCLCEPKTKGEEEEYKIRQRQGVAAKLHLCMLFSIRDATRDARLYDPSLSNIIFLVRQLPIPRECLKIVPTVIMCIDP